MLSREKLFSMLIKLFVIFPVICVFFNIEIYSSQNDTTFFKDDPDDLLLNLRQTVLVVPINTIHEKIINNTQKSNSTPPDDSFFIESANNLINFECSKNFNICSNIEALNKLNESLSLFYDSRYSKLTKNDTNFAEISALMKKTAETFKVDLIILPFFCNIEHITFQQKGWRDAPNYNKPVKYYSKTRVHIQIWDKTGKLIYERIGKDQTRRPVLYSLFKKKNKEPKEGEGVNHFAKSFFAPPAIRSLSKSIENAMIIQKKEI